MDMLAMLDYSLIILFFVGVIGLTIVIMSAPVDETAPQTTPPSQPTKEMYASLVILFIVLVALAFFVQRRQPSA